MLCRFCYSVGDDIRYFDTEAKGNPRLCDDLIQNEPFHENSTRRKSEKRQNKITGFCWWHSNLMRLTKMINKKAKLKKRNMAEIQLKFNQLMRFYCWLVSGKKRTMCDSLHSMITASKMLCTTSNLTNCMCHTNFQCERNPIGKLTKFGAIFAQNFSHVNQLQIFSFESATFSN